MHSDPPLQAARRAPRGLPAGALALALLATLAGCGSVDSATRGMADAITLYKPEVVQGNFVSREQVAALRPGMTRLQVRDILGTPLVASVFHSDRWDYVFMLKRQGIEPQHFRLTVYFRDDALDRFDGDDMPGENEFVERIDSQGAAGKSRAPVLEATEEQLARYPLPAVPQEGGAADDGGAAAAAPARAGQYPPLESGGN
ncbi:MAG: outer membrane protein assembly factor BamE [Burkholderiaceae bacterium]|jgi:outer membrane protein assembly factor BamE|nr:outer membrane protein assembly factor BamE [Burkholderiaceae bacterium]